MVVVVDAVNNVRSKHDGVFSNFNLCTVVHVPGFGYHIGVVFTGNSHWYNY